MRKYLFVWCYWCCGEVCFNLFYFFFFIAHAYLRSLNFYENDVNARLHLFCIKEKKKGSMKFSSRYILFSVIRMTRLQNLKII